MPGPKYTHKVYLHGTEFQSVESLRQLFGNHEFEIADGTSRRVSSILTTDHNAESLERLGATSVPLDELKYAVT